MFVSTTVSSPDEIRQIYRLNQVNLKQNLNAAEKASDGFVSWLYSVDLLEKMHALAPSVIVKHQDRVVGYALTTLKESRSFHRDLETMFRQLEPVLYLGKPLPVYNFYCMGQICVDKTFRGKGIVSMLYNEHKKVYGKQFDFILTEISSSNPRSLKAHLNMGFEIIYTYTDAIDEWHVVVWDWS
jgi:hypothetical protein